MKKGRKEGRKAAGKDGKNEGRKEEKKEGLEGKGSKEARPPPQPPSSSFRFCAKTAFVTRG